MGEPALLGQPPLGVCPRDERHWREGGLSVCEGVGIQRKEGIDQPDNPAEVFTVNSVAKAVVDRRHKCPMVWPANGDAVYAYISHGTANPGGLWRSLNRGKSWSLLIPFSTNDRWSSHLIADPNNATSLYFVRRDNEGTAGAGVWRVNNANGAHTATRILTLTEPGPIAITRSGRLYAISLPSDSGGSALRYTDNPTVAAPTWVKVNDAFLEGALGYAHHMAAGADGTLYIAKFDGGYLVGDPA